MRHLKEIDKFLDSQARIADQRPQSSLREFLVVGHGKTPVGRLGVTKDHVASLLHGGVALRNRLVHAYFDLGLPVLWNLASTQAVGGGEG